MSGYDTGDESNIELIQKIHNHKDFENGNIGHGIGKSNGDIEIAGAESVSKSKSWFNWCKSAQWKSTLGHIGLLISLSIYCGVGGLVSDLNAIKLY